jgi:mono/diheme cytochrome c family protein
MGTWATDKAQAMRNFLLSLIVLFVTACAVWGEEGANSDEVRAGHKLAVLVCGNCHVAATDQPNEPILRTPAASFESIAQRTDVRADWIENYLKTTHRDLDNPNGMPNPQLLDFQIKQVTAYLLSLRKSP